MSQPEGITTIRAGFLLTGQGIQPAEITARVGLRPTVTWREGEARLARSPLVHPTDGWAIRTDYEVALDLASHVNRILELVHPVAAPIRALCQELGLAAEIECVARIIGDTEQTAPIIFFSSDLISKISELGADVDIDINLVGSEE